MWLNVHTWKQYILLRVYRGNRYCADQITWYLSPLLQHTAAVCMARWSYTFVGSCSTLSIVMDLLLFRLYFVFYECRTESHGQLFFACELGIADEGECGGRWNQLLCYPWVSCDVNSLHHSTSITPNKMADNDVVSPACCHRIPCERGNPCCRNSPETSACLWKCVHGCEQCWKMGEIF